jgi:hypothetical protein
VRWQAFPGNARGKHLRIGEDHRSSSQRRSGRGHHVRMEGKSIDNIDVTAGMNHSNRDGAHVCWQPGQISL